MKCFTAYNIPAVCVVVLADKPLNWHRFFNFQVDALRIVDASFIT